jgi:hypothetical protein
MRASSRISLPKSSGTASGPGTSAFVLVDTSVLAVGIEFGGGGTGVVVSDAVSGGGTGGGGGSGGGGASDADADVDGAGAGSVPCAEERADTSATIVSGAIAASA